MTLDRTLTPTITLKKFEFLTFIKILTKRTQQFKDKNIINIQTICITQ